MIGHAVADDSWPTASSDLAGAMPTLRTLIGLPATDMGTDNGAAATETPNAVMTQDVDADTVDVLLLVHSAAYNPSQPNLDKSVVVVKSVPVHWDGTDWRMMQPVHLSDDDRQRLTVDPDSTAATSLGWRDVRA